MKLKLLLLLVLAVQCEMYDVGDYCKVEEFYNEDGEQKERCYP